MFKVMYDAIERFYKLLPEHEIRKLDKERKCVFDIIKAGYENNMDGIC